MWYPYPIGPVSHVNSPLFWLPFFLLWFRQREGWSQKKFCLFHFFPPKIGTYVTKIEGGSILPTIRCLDEYARALHVDLGELLRLCEWMAAGAGAGNQGIKIGNASGSYISSYGVTTDIR